MYFGFAPRSQIFSNYHRISRARLPSPTLVTEFLNALQDELTVIFVTIGSQGFRDLPLLGWSIHVCGGFFCADVRFGGGVFFICEEIFF